MTIFKTGDTVRVQYEGSFSDKYNGMEFTIDKFYGNGNASGPLISLGGGYAPARSGYRLGERVVFRPDQIELVPEPEFPREANFNEIQVGDTVRVTYPEQSNTNYGVAQTMTRVREGVVDRIDGDALITDGEGLINGYFDGRANAVYEILERPEPEPEPELEFRVGDYVSYTWTSQWNGGKGIVTDVDPKESLPFKVQMLETPKNMIGTRSNDLSRWSASSLKMWEKPKHWTEERPVGSLGLQKNGTRILRKLNGNLWETQYPSKNTTRSFQTDSRSTRTNADMARLIPDDSDFLWTEQN